MTFPRQSCIGNARQVSSLTCVSYVCLLPFWSKIQSVSRLNWKFGCASHPRLRHSASSISHTHISNILFLLSTKSFPIYLFLLGFYRFLSRLWYMAVHIYLIYFDCFDGFLFQRDDFCLKVSKSIEIAHAWYKKCGCRHKL